MNLKYHQKTFDLLSLKPKISKELLEQLKKVEQQCEISIPPSVREWYSIEQAMEILRNLNTHNSSVDIFKKPHSPEEWEEINKFWFGNTLPNGFLVFVSEHAGVFNWAIKLDKSDDPPIFIEIDSVPNFVWQLYSKTFSEFIFELVLEFVNKPNNIRLDAYTSTITQSDLLNLTQHFFMLPTLIYPSNKVYRFRLESQGIKIREEKCALWSLSANSPSLMFDLASQIWEMGYHLNYFFVPEWNSFCENQIVEKQVLARIKLAGKLEEEILWTKYRQECFDKKHDNK